MMVYAMQPEQGLPIEVIEYPSPNWFEILLSGSIGALIATITAAVIAYFLAKNAFKEELAAQARTRRLERSHHAARETGDQLNRIAKQDIAPTLRPPQDANMITQQQAGALLAYSQLVREGWVYDLVWLSIEIDDPNIEEWILRLSRAGHALGDEIFGLGSDPTESDVGSTYKKLLSLQFFFGHVLRALSEHRKEEDVTPFSSEVRKKFPELKFDLDVDRSRQEHPPAMTHLQ